MENLFLYVEGIYNQLPSMPLGLNSSSLKILTSTSFKEIIDNESHCINLINTIIEFDQEPVYLNPHRASHILITWLLGLGFGKHFGIKNNDSSFSKLCDAQLWLQTAIIHDYGYFCREIKKPFLRIEEITSEYDLFVDYYNQDDLCYLNGMSNLEEFRRYFTYDYNEIKKYFTYSQSLHNQISKDEIELSDHGIVGGCIAFKKYCKRVEKFKRSFNYGASIIITQIQKIACIIAASHNIFKSKDSTTDITYREFQLDNLLSSSPIRIKKENNILTLLSLVDTVECTKRFSKHNSNDGKYLIQSTVLNNIEIEPTENSLIIDYSKLREYILKNRQSKEMNGLLNNHINGILNLGGWTEFTANYHNDDSNIISIELKKTS